LDLPLITISTLDILAAATFFPGSLVAPLMDAKQGHIYVAFYEETWPSPRPLTGYLALRPPELASEALRLAAGREVAVCGDGVSLAREALNAAGVPVREMPPVFNYPRAGVLGMLAFVELAQGAAGDAAAAEPLYVRRAAAELAREAKHGTCS
jgi:tRNA A37 threonylcarbamoyladenosine modification protein TsaB